MVKLAVDLGAKRVGVAVSDPAGHYAMPVAMLEVRSREDAINQVMRLITEYTPGEIIIGMPLNMDGSTGQPARDTLAWGSRLHERTGTKVVYVDERLSSFEAEQKLTDRKQTGERMTRADRKEKVDAQAATIILNAYLHHSADVIDPANLN